jgi:RNA methyltransferase, TrmH family
LLTDAKAAKVRGVAKLAKKDARSLTGLFLLEGLQGLKEVLDRPKLVVELYATEECVSKNIELFERAKNSRIEVQLVSEPVLKAMCDTTTPQGVVAVVRQMHVSVDDILATKPKLVAILSQIRDPGNAGTVLRAADASGADAVIFTTNSVDAYNPKVVRSTTGSLFHLPFAIEADPAETIAAIKAAGLTVFAATAQGDLVSKLEADVLKKPTAWMFGNEAWGFDAETLALADREVAVPIYGAAESLNLATAASVCLYVSAFAQNG